jgi:hypothetical protein
VRASASLICGSLPHDFTCDPSCAQRVWNEPNASVRR